MFQHDPFLIAISDDRIPSIQSDGSIPKEDLILFELSADCAGRLARVGNSFVVMATTLGLVAITSSAKASSKIA